MKDLILAELARRPLLSNADLCLALGSVQSTMSRYLSELKQEGRLSSKYAPKGKKLWYLSPMKENRVTEPYQIEKTLHKVRQIRSLFEPV